ncbi:MAG: hypothetical protein ACK56I_28790, partial [bacterium]
HVLIVAQPPAGGRPGCSVTAQSSTRWLRTRTEPSSRVSMEPRSSRLFITRQIIRHLASGLVVDQIEGRTLLMLVLLKQGQRVAALAKGTQEAQIGLLRP